MAVGEVVHLEFSVAMHGPFRFPPNKLPISSIVWLCLMEEIDLKKPFEIEMPHIHQGLAKEDIQHYHICFAKADHTGLLDSDGQKYYQFEEVEDANHVLFQSNHGILHIKHCCYLCVIEKKNPQVVIDADFCLAKVILKYSSRPLRHVIHFYVTFDLPTCRKVNIIF